ncbi:hypothetical protein EYF80_062233 [Liparis tanakae]|uniref:Uncharacterized protein n=1 Tax=Liparis tanakae TaxID=230148 RepID=A0A4Z2EG48_9TELE|nr:hypothetical protein EYF80_062233 [Liparis tanakae]
MSSAWVHSTPTGCLWVSFWLLPS